MAERVSSVVRYDCLLVLECEHIPEGHDVDASRHDHSVLPARVDEPRALDVVLAIAGAPHCPIKDLSAATR